MRRQILFPYKVISMHTNFNFTKNFILDIIQSEISLLWNDMIRVITWTKRIRWLLKKNRRFVWSFFFLYFPIAAMVFASWEILTHTTEMNQLLYIIVMTKGRKVYDFFILWMVVISNCWVVPSVLLYQIDR